MDNDRARSLIAFWAERNWTTRWGVRDKNHPDGHKGFDVGAPAGTWMPILRPGRIVSIGESSVLGKYFVVQVGPGDFDGYRHQMYDPSIKGRTVARGEGVSWLAGAGDPHGSAWTGPHVCVTNGASQGTVLGISTRNPEGIVRAALAAARTALAGGDIEPIPDDVTPTPPPPTGVDMLALTNDTDGRVFLRGPRGRAHIVGYPKYNIGALQMLVLLQRALAEARTGARDTFLSIEQEAIDYYVGQVSWKDFDPADVVVNLDADALAAELAEVAASSIVAPVLAELGVSRQQILAAIDQVDEATLATFGLQRRS